MLNLVVDAVLVYNALSLNTNSILYVYMENSATCIKVKVIHMSSEKLSTPMMHLSTSYPQVIHICFCNIKKVLDNPILLTDDRRSFMIATRKAFLRVGTHPEKTAFTRVLRYTFLLKRRRKLSCLRHSKTLG